MFENFIEYAILGVVGSIVGFIVFYILGMIIGFLDKRSEAISNSITKTLEGLFMIFCVIYCFYLLGQVTELLWMTISGNPIIWEPPTTALTLFFRNL